MISLEEKKLFKDIEIAILSIHDHLNHTFDFNLYQQNKTIRRAVERELEIIGEAINNLLKIKTELKISYARQIVDLRNKVIHAYDNVNNIIIWKIVTKDLPVLLSEVNTYLNSDHD